MKIKQYGPRMEELKREGKTLREIAADVGLKYEQVKERYFYLPFWIYMTEVSLHTE